MAKILKSNNTFSSFNGVNSYLQYADNDIFSFTDGVNDIPFSFEFDIYPKILILSDVRFIIQKRYTVGEWQVLISTNNIVGITLFGVNPTKQIQVYTTVGIQTNAQTIVKITYDGSKLWTGVKIYFNNILQIVANYSSGVYTGMVNTSSVVGIGGMVGSSTRYLNGYLRNLKITKNNQLVFWATLQDTNNIGKDIISGLSPTIANNVSVVDINTNVLKSQNTWAHFDGYSSQILNIGNYDFNFIHETGIFCIEFDILILDTQRNYLGIFCTNVISNPIQRGISIGEYPGGRLNINIGNGTLAIAQISVGSFFTIGEKTKVKILGDGVSMKLYKNNVLNTSVNYLGTFGIGNSQYKGDIGIGNQAYRLNAYLKNLKIYNTPDTSNLVSYFPLQDSLNVSKDVIRGSIGTVNSVIVRNETETNNYNPTGGVLFYDANAGSGTLASSLVYTDNDIFSFTDGVNDIPFVIEFDMYPKRFINYNFIVEKRNTVTEFEYQISLNLSGQLGFYIGTNSTNYIYKLTSALVVDSLYHIKCTYDGSKTLAGMKIFINGVEQSTSNYTVGTYIGMINTTNPLTFGNYTSTGNPYIGFLRNFKITKNGNEVFNIPLTNPNNISLDIIGGLSASTITRVAIPIENSVQNWAYFNGVNASATIGTTSTLGWMNSGTFNMQFELVPLSSIGSKNIIYLAGGVSQLGLRLFWYNNLIYVYWYNGGGVQSLITSLGNFIINNKYRIVLQGDGNKFYFTNYNSDGSINSTNIPAGASIVYIANPITSFALNLGAAPGSQYSNVQLRNFKIFSDFAGTIPFMSLPMQNSTDLMLDRVSGLQGTAKNVSIVNNNTNVLRNKNLWCKFDGITGKIAIGTTSTLGWMNTGVFKIEFEVTPITISSSAYILYTSYGINTRGFAFYTNSSLNTIAAYLMNGTAIYPFNSTGLVNLPLNNRYLLTLEGNGIQCRYIQHNLDTGIEVFNSGWLDCIYNTFATTTQVLSMSVVAKANCYLRNVKIFTDTEGKVPFMNLPLTDGGNIAKDIVGGLQGTATNVNVVEI